MGVEEASDGSLWLAENREVIEIAATEIQQALGDPSYRVKYRIFDSFDGLPGTFAGVVFNSRVIQATDGNATSPERKVKDAFGSLKLRESSMHHTHGNSSLTDR